MRSDIEIIEHDIVVVQSLKGNDKKTGEELYKDIIRYKPVLCKDVHVDFYSVSNRVEFEKVLANIEKDIPANHTLTLHLEAHGCIDGVELASLELLGWKDLFSLIRPLNIKIHNLLMMIMSVCNGAAISSFIEPTKRCPFRAFVGFENVMCENDLLKAYTAFYESYNNMLDIAEALFRVNSIMTKDARVWCLRAKDIFESVLNPDTNPDSFNKVIDANYDDYVRREGFVAKNQYREQVRRFFIETANTYRSYYNFED